MQNSLLQYDAVHIIGLSITIFALIITAVLIRRFTKKYENMEIFWVPWWLVIAFILGQKFI